VTGWVPQAADAVVLLPVDVGRMSLVRASITSGAV
jgi:hypothetical protein